MRSWFKNLRITENLSQNNVAIMSGVDVTTINKIELGERRPSVEVAKKIAEVLNFKKYGFDWTKFYEDEVVEK